eukprot:scaffold1984_cov162-Amphora_coffeaeformis.AAC.6
MAMVPYGKVLMRAPKSVLFFCVAEHREIVPSQSWRGARSKSLFFSTEPERVFHRSQKMVRRERQQAGESVATQA